MFEQLFKQPSAIKRYLAAPLARSRLRYLTHCARQGAAQATLQRVAANQVAVVRFLDLGEDGPVGLERIEAAASRWAAQFAGRRAGNDGPACRTFVARAVGWLRFAGRLERSEAPLPPGSTKVAEFAAWMREERGLSERTINSRCRLANELFLFLGERNIPLERVAIIDVDRFLSGKATDGGCSRRSIQTYAKHLRAFFRYAENRGWCVAGLSTGIATPRVHADETLPVGPSWDEVRRLLATTAGERPADLRDRAVLQLLVTYGLRAGEVAGLRLDDIDWEAETLSVRRPKPGRTHLYPLCGSVGESILRYLQGARPRSTRREVFFTLRAPIRPITRYVIRRVVASRRRGLDIRSQRCSPHALRHACAQRLLDKGFSMKEIGDCLGHRSPVSTAVYARVDLAGLREVADFDWEGLA